MGWESKIRGPFWRHRYFKVPEMSLNLLATDEGAHVVHPFVSPRVLDTLASTGGFRGFGTRSELLDYLFGDVLPANVIKRGGKATFGTPLWTSTSRDFAQTWSGEGIDSQFVDRDVLRGMWLAGEWTVASTTLLQAAWIHDHSDCTDR